MALSDTLGPGREREQRRGKRSREREENERGSRGGVAWRLQPASGVGRSRRWLGRVDARVEHATLVLLARGGR